MCGIAGFWHRSRSSGKADLERTARRMSAALRHRGPDDGGVWADVEAGIAMAHRRLAILDLSSEGHQPMRSANGRYVLVFNGEIYNFKKLGAELQSAGHKFRGHSDTEVMLASFCEWGIEAALKRFVGMFAFALWDRQQRMLHLARDRAGEKPLYYGWTGGAFVFGSELKALRGHPQWQAEVDPGAVALLLRYGYVPAPHCIYQNCYKLLPGCVLTLSQEHIAAQTLPRPKPYWSFRAIAEAGIAQPFAGGLMEAKERLLKLLRESVAQQMIADVPVGAFLSGGIDSSTIVALMQAQSPRPIKTFSIGFEQPDFDEAPFAAAVARHLGTEHTELYVTEKDLQRVIPRLPAIYDEPFADTSQIPTVLLCELARERVTVSLSGDAGDELFGGYAAYRKTQHIWRCLSRIPAPLRENWAKHLRRLGGIALGGTVSAGVPGRPASERESVEAFPRSTLIRSDAPTLRLRPGRLTRALNRVENFSQLLPAATDKALYQLLMSPCREPQAWLKEPAEPPTTFSATSPWQQLPGLLPRMMHQDFVSYLPDDILVKVDRAAMSVSLETRIPLLDHRVIEFAWRLPGSLQQRRGQGKWLLRQILHEHVPPALVKRPKHGFAVPIADWLRGPLRPWAEEWLNGTRLRQEGFFDEKTVRQKWSEHLSQKRDWGQPLWNVLTFQAWLEEQNTTVPQSERLASETPRTATFAEACQL